jgi:hypothetical protein
VGSDNSEGTRGPRIAATEKLDDTHSFVDIYSFDGLNVPLCMIWSSSDTRSIFIKKT